MSELLVPVALVAGWGLAMWAVGLWAFEGQPPKQKISRISRRADTVRYAGTQTRRLALRDEAAEAVLRGEDPTRIEW